MSRAAAGRLPTFSCHGLARALRPACRLAWLPALAADPSLHRPAALTGADSAYCDAPWPVPCVRVQSFAGCCPPSCLLGSAFRPNPWTMSLMCGGGGDGGMDPELAKINAEVRPRAQVDVRV